jgi:hypothetical protein
MALAPGTRVHGTLPRRTTRSSGPGSFSLDVRAWVEKVKGRSDLIVRKISIDLLSSVIEMSPVGNPELWAANASAVYGRETHNLFVDAHNADVDRFNAGLASQGESAFKGQKLVGAQKPAKRAGTRKLVQQYPLNAGKGYVGGRFKGNWQVSIGSKRSGVTGRIDASGSATLAAGTTVANAAKAGDVIFIVNNVPYAIPLEYGHSKQAPAGMVGVTVARFQQLVDQAAREAKAEIP